MTVVGLVVNEFAGVSPWAARRLIRWAAYRWSADPEIAAGYAEEWIAIINERPGKLLKLLTGIAFASGAMYRTGARCAAEIKRFAEPEEVVLFYMLGSYPVFGSRSSDDPSDHAAQGTATEETSVDRSQM